MTEKKKKHMRYVTEDRRKAKHNQVHSPLERKKEQVKRRY
jgi:hypothetical protein